MTTHEDNTFFASPERSNISELHSELREVASNEVLEGILRNTSGMLAIINENRQILAINDTLLQMLGIDDPESVLGLRPGEQLTASTPTKCPQVRSRNVVAGHAAERDRAELINY